MLTKRAHTNLSAQKHTREKIPVYWAPDLPQCTRYVQRNQQDHSTDVRHRRNATFSLHPHPTHTPTCTHIHTRKELLCSTFQICAQWLKIFSIAEREMKRGFLKIITPWLPVIGTDDLFIILEVRLLTMNRKNRDCVRTQQTSHSEQRGWTEYIQLVGTFLLLTEQQETLEGALSGQANVSSTLMAEFWICYIFDLLHPLAEVTSFLQFTTRESYYFPLK